MILQKNIFQLLSFTYIRKSWVDFDRFFLMEQNVDVWRRLFYLSLVRKYYLLFQWFKLMKNDSNYYCRQYIGIDYIKKCFFRAETLGLTDLHPVEMLQDQAQCILGDYVRNRYQRQPTRFGRLLLAIPLLRMIRTSTIEMIFFKETVGDASVIRLLHDMYRADNIQNQTKLSDISIARMFPTQPFSHQLIPPSSLSSIPNTGTPTKSFSILSDENNSISEENSLRSSPSPTKNISALAAAN